MTLINWRPKSVDLFRELDDAQSHLLGLTMFPGLEKGFLKGGWPALDVEEDKNNISVKADLPGLKQEEIEISVDEDGMLTIKGERKSEVESKDKNYHKVERAYGAFERSLRIGVPIDREKVKAAYKNGVLEVTLPKIEKTKPKQIKVDVN
ncbi:MAG TPA: Hsp20/alpha crystallin family protein [Candidatus Omnitrophota bacterium]|nr:Hsp20/alpha crystallin family protein [Candidatus Omnitrophota bacterium]HPD84164.1 Hsp20/alpha crystallin family protein [Candidatus Omnitrophota bacterium]HRZ03021.1 Hsp20/alpha crystallin family protein [Candidatus Omnitrophota bacterium]